MKRFHFLTAAVLLLAMTGCKSDPAVEPEPQKPEVIPVESITLDNDEALMWPEVVVHTMTATVLPENATNKAVTWKSSDTSIATVNGGEVVAHEEGEVTITATAGDKSATCHIIVASDKPKLVDMGLSVKWADRNVGAVGLRDYGQFSDAVNPWGDYYSWGNPETQEVYDWEHYPYVTSNSAICKYFGEYRDTAAWGGEGDPDRKQLLDPEDDAATAKYGENWRMPTRDEWAELVENCSWECTQLHGINVIKATSYKNNAILYLPLAGYMYYNSLIDEKGSYGFYWSSVLYADYPYKAYYSIFGSDSVDIYDFDRCEGFSVRAVYGERPHATAVSIVNKDTEPLLPGEYIQLQATVTPQFISDKSITWSSSNTAVATVDENGMVKAVAAGTATITAATTDGSLTDTVDITVTDQTVTVNSLTEFNSCTTGIPCWVLSSDLGGTQVITRRSGIIDFNGHRVYNVHMRNDTPGRLVLLRNGTITNLLDGNVGWGDEYAGTVILEDMKVGSGEQGVYTDGHHYVVKSGEYVGFSTYGKNGSVIIYGGKFGIHFDSNPDAYYNQSPVTIYGGKFAFNPATTAGKLGRSKITIPEGYSVKDNTDSDKNDYPYIVSAD